MDGEKPQPGDIVDSHGNVVVRAREAWTPDRPTTNSQNQVLWRVKVGGRWVDPPTSDVRTRPKATVYDMSFGRLMSTRPAVHHVKKPLLGKFKRGPRNIRSV